VPSDPGDISALASSWLAAAADPAVVAELLAIHAMIRDQVEARGPACWASGRCCRFGTAGHRLYVTGLEAAHLVLHLGRSPTLAEIEAARRRDDCPFLIANACSVHAFKPTGCRIYFCDASAQDWQQDLSERVIAMLRALHERRGIEYRYGEWRAMLEAFATA
jgi:Fe-S-cluster containining protein